MLVGPPGNYPAWSCVKTALGTLLDRLGSRRENCSPTNSSEHIYYNLIIIFFLQLIGFLISLMDVITLSRLHIRPIQWYIRDFWQQVS